MEWTFIALGGLLTSFVILNLKTSRPDGTLCRGVHPYRRMMAYLMPTRDEAVVFFDRAVRAGELLRFLAERKGQANGGLNLTHAVLGAVARGFSENPAMNRFVAGHRLYDRKGIFLTFSMKRVRLDQQAKLSTVKLEVGPGEPFSSLCDRINQGITVERSGEKTYQDTELGILTRIPRPVLRWATGLLRWLDYYNLVPGAFLEKDPFYTSIFVANLGSLGMGAAYHHLFEWGTCPLFLMVGKVEERPVASGGQVVVEPVLPLRFTYDERIDDGLTANQGIETIVRILENPFAELT
jgi:hypothetical protein